MRFSIHFQENLAESISRARFVLNEAILIRIQKKPNLATERLAEQRAIDSLLGAAKRVAICRTHEPKAHQNSNAMSTEVLR